MQGKIPRKKTRAKTKVKKKNSSKRKVQLGLFFNIKNLPVSIKIILIQNTLGALPQALLYYYYYYYYCYYYYYYYYYF